MGDNCGMHIDEHHDWTDGFTNWDQVWAHLQGDWAGIVDIRKRLELVRDPDALLVVESVRQLRARQRRALHRLGFRPLADSGVTTWRWDVDEQVRTANPADFPHPLLALYEQLDPDDRPPTYAVLRVRVVTEGLISEVARQVLQDVFGSAPADIVVVTYLELDRWDEEDDTG